MADDELNRPAHHPPGAVIPSLVEGQITFGRYRLKKLLGRGGFGVVWLAHDEDLGMDVAVKFLSELLASDKEAVADLKRETRNSLKLTHSNIMRIYGFVQGDNMAGISMEYVDGDTLSAMKVAREERCFNVQDLAPYLTQVCDALDYAHQKAQVVHRDLKPANLMINARKELKIADFGISRSISDTHTRLTDFTSSSGTPAFMSPQQMMGESPSPSDDVYSLGATLYDLLSGKPPFYTGDIVQQVWRAVPVSIEERRRVLQIEAPPVPYEWEQVIAACLSKEAEGRPPSAGAVAEMLGLKMPTGEHISDYSVTMPTITLTRPGEPPVPDEKARKSAGRIIRDWVLLGAAVLGLVLTGMFARSPEASVEPASLDFGTVALGAGANQSFTVTNTGGRRLTGEVLAACPDFLVVSGAGSYSLKSNESVTVTIRFSPNKVGKSGCAVALGRGLEATHIPVVGIGEGGTGGRGAVVKPPSRDPDGEKSQAPALGSRTEPERKSTGSSSVASTSLPAPATGQPAAMPETAVGPVVPGIRIEPQRLDFGTFVVGAESKPLTFTIMNTGEETVQGRVTMDCADFNFRSGDGEFSLKKGKTREVRIRFKPKSGGPRTCVVDTGVGRVALTGLAQGAEAPVDGSAAASETSATTEEQAQIRAVVQKYEAAQEALDARAFLDLWATGRGPGQRYMEDRFARYRSQEVSVSVGSIRVDGTTASVSLSSRSKIVMADGTAQELSQKGTMRLVKGRDDRWLLHELSLN
jgi:serine/threonine protein kinase/ketosteroid isomerase-like protein